VVGAFNVVGVVMGDRDGETVLDEEEVDALFGPDGGGNFVGELVGYVGEFFFLEEVDFFEWVICVEAVEVFEGVRLGVIVVGVFDGIEVTAEEDVIAGVFLDKVEDIFDLFEAAFSGSVPYVEVDVVDGDGGGEVGDGDIDDAFFALMESGEGDCFGDGFDFNVGVIFDESDITVVIELIIFVNNFVCIADVRCEVIFSKIGDNFVVEECFLEEYDIGFGFDGEVDNIFETGCDFFFGDSILRFEWLEEVMDVIGGNHEVMRVRFWVDIVVDCGGEVNRK